MESQPAAIITAKVRLQLETGMTAHRTSLSADGARALVCSQLSSDIWLFDVASGRCLRTFKGHTTGGVRDLKWSTDELRVLSGGDDSTVRLWDVASAHNTSVLNVGGVVSALTWWSNCRFMIAGLANGSIEVWDTENGQSVWDLRGHTDSVSYLDVSADQNSLLSASADKTIRLWNLGLGNCVRALQGHMGNVHSAVFSRDGRSALSGSRDTTVRVWDLVTGRCIRILEGHKDQVSTAVWHPSTAFVAVSGSHDQNVRVWNVDTGACLGILEGHQNYVKWYLHWSLDGQHLTSSDIGGTAVSWDLSAMLATPTTTAVLTDQVQYTNAKVLLVGDSGAGKSGLSMRLALNKWSPTDSTVGAWSTRWSLGNAGDATGRGEREIWLWDFGGQHDQRLVHQLFMDDTALAVLVFDGQRDGVVDTLRQWNRDISRASRAGCRKVLVAGRVDAGAPRLPREDLQAFAKVNGFFGFFETSAKTGFGCEELKAAILREIDWDRIPRRSSPESFKSLKNVLLAIKDEALASPRPSILMSIWQSIMSAPPQQAAGQIQSKVSGLVLVTMEDLAKNIRYRERRIQFTDEELKTVLSLLSGPGMVWELKFGGYYLLHPELLASYLQGVLRQDCLPHGHVKESDVFAGVLPADLTRLDDATKDRLLLLEVHLTLLERALCYREMTKENGPVLVFPTRSKADVPTDWQPHVVVTYTFGGYVEEAYATVVVRLHNTETFKDAELFRDFARFKTASGLVGIKIKRLADPVEFQVLRDLAVTDEIVIDFCAFIHEHLFRYDHELNRFRHFTCSDCGTVVANREAVMAKIKRYKDAVKLGEKSKKPSAVCALCDQPVLLWDSLEEHYAYTNFHDRVRALQEYSKVRLERQASERVLIADIISVVLRAGHEITELPVLEFGASLKVTLRPEGAPVLVVLGTPESLHNTTKARFIDSDVLQSAPEWTARRLRVALVLRVDGIDIQWTPLSGVRIERQRAEFQGRLFDMDAVRSWKDLPTSSAEESQQALALTNPARSHLSAAVPWTTRHKWFDVFLSFRGDEPLGARGGAKTDTIRVGLVKPLAAELRKEGMDVFVDDMALAEEMAEVPGAAIVDILQGVMSTQGGVAALLISRTYFERERSTLELASCVELHCAHQIRLRAFLLGDVVTPEWVKSQTFVREICPALLSVPMYTVPPSDAAAMLAFIKGKIQEANDKDNGIAGGTIADSFSTLKNTIADRLRNDFNAQNMLAGALLHRELWPNESLLSAFEMVPTLSAKKLGPLREAICNQLDTDAFRDLYELVERYEFRWHISAKPSSAVTDLGGIKARVDTWWSARAHS